METTIYYIHSFDFENQSEVCNEVGHADPEKIMNHPNVEVLDLNDFIHRLNVDEIDSQGYFAYKQA